MKNIIEGLLIVSAQASVMLLCVILLRIVLRKTYKIFTCVMWMIVLLRLCIPIQLESPYGILGMNKKVVVETSKENIQDEGDWREDLPLHNNQNNISDNEMVDTPIVWPNVNKDNNVQSSTVKQDSGLEISLSKEQVVMAVWVAGIIVLTTFATVQVIILKKKTRLAINIVDNIWETDGINTAFVMGIFKARIYIPTNISDKEREHIVLHEKMHIKHGDNIVRVVMLVINILYWWNPLVWVATHIMKKDMEMFCDESVIKNMDMSRQVAYLRTLLNCSAKNSGIIPIMSFGETNTEVRIRHIMNLKKPKFYIFLALAVFLAVSVVGCTKVAKVNTDDDYNEETTTEEKKDNSGKEETNEQETSETAVETPTGENYEVAEGIYVNEDENYYIVITSNNVSIWDKTKFAGNLDLEYYMSCVYSYCQNYYYDYSGNTIQLYEGITDKEAVNELKIIDRETIRFEDRDYVYIENSEVIYVINSTGYAQYDELIEKIVSIRVSEDGDLMDSFREQDICYIWAYGSTYEHGGFYLIDLDGDGIEEMLLGENGSGAWAGTIYEIYSIKNGELVKLCDGGERDRYYLSQGNTIYNEGSSGAANSTYAIYECKDGELVLKTGIVFDGDYDSENPYFLCDESFNAETGTSISSDEAQIIMDSYAKIPIEFSLFVVPEF